MAFLPRLTALRLDLCYTTSWDTIDAIERQLAHVESNKVRATYNKALLLDQRRALLQDWADYLSAAEDSGTA
nr:hypothetical protein [Stutzerimonas kirkiae]